MSRLSIDSLHVLLGPDAVQAAPCSAFTGSVGKPRVFRVGASAADSAWERPLPALAEALRHFGLRRVRLQLSQAFVQLRVLPWRAELLNVAELEALARHDFSAAFGNIADDWRITMSDEPPGRARLVAAMPHPLLHALQAQAAQSGARLISVEPALVAASRRWHPGRDASGCHWLVQYESGRLCVLVRAKGQWAWVRHARLEGSWFSQLPQWLKAEALMSGLDLLPSRVTVHAPGLEPANLQALQASGLRFVDSGWAP